MFIFHLSLISTINRGKIVIHSFITLKVTYIKDQNLFSFFNKNQGYPLPTVKTNPSLYRSFFEGTLVLDK